MIFFCDNLMRIEQLEPITLGHLNITPILTPGHTQGAICYSIDNALFTGDTLFTEGCGICTAKGGDPNAMFDSLSLLKATIPHQTKIYPGHSFGQEPGKTFGDLLQNNIYLHFTERAAFIAFRMRENQTGLLNFR